jgi:hypothetical protein
MSNPPPATRDRWFCVEDCSNAKRPTILLPAATLAECHSFIDERRKTGHLGHYRVNYSMAMRRFLAANTSQAA